jgi:hypothetical protein
LKPVVVFHFTGVRVVARRCQAMLGLYTSSHGLRTLSRAHLRGSLNARTLGRVNWIQPVYSVPHRGVVDRTRHSVVGDDERLERHVAQHLVKTLRRRSRTENRGDFNSGQEKRITWEKTILFLFGKNQKPKAKSLGEVSATTPLTAPLHTRFTLNPPLPFPRRTDAPLPSP